MNTKIEEISAEEALILFETQLNMKVDASRACIKIKDVVVGNLSDMSLVIGAPKSKKTFFVSALAAAALSGKEILNLKVSLPDNHKRVVFVDTEQSDDYACICMNRIYKMAGLNRKVKSKRFNHYHLRTLSCSQRLEVVQQIFNNFTDVGLMIIDGVADLLTNHTNDEQESKTLVAQLMTWCQTYGTHICVVLHSNKVNDLARGHLGGELARKVETLIDLSLSKNNKNVTNKAQVTIVSPAGTRGESFENFAFEIDQKTIEPRLIELERSNSSSEFNFSVKNIPQTTHVQAMNLIRSKTQKEMTSKVLYSFLKEAYEKITPSSFGESKLKELRTHLIDKGYIKKTSYGHYALNNC